MNKGILNPGDPGFIAPTSVPSSQSFDKLLDSFIALEIKRTDAIKKAEKAATNQKSNVTLKFVEVAGYANYVLENIQRYFNASKVMLDFEKGESNLSEETVNLKTLPLRTENYLNRQMRRLASIYKNLEAGQGGLPQDMLSKLRPVMDIIKQSERAPTSTPSTSTLPTSTPPTSTPPTSIPPTSTPPSKSFDELLDAFMVVENDRKAAIKIAEEAAKEAGSNTTLNFLKVVREADKVLENLRRYFDAGKKTELLRKNTYLNDELIKLSAYYKSIEAHVPDLPKGMNRVMRPVIELIKQSEHALIPLGTKFRDDLERTKPTSA
ncbi:unnamed protein product [Bemisia tabaci]|uniref:Uncharacterized protein n=1 Tax=Bemisia tabaci TaxID=7038 RepID=A0A9P0ANW8_BEMTA|nr:unnamed protein product [Bemisia tabaci]